MKLIFIISLILSTSLNAYSQAWVWEKPINTTNNSIATDPNNNIIVLSQNGNATQLSKFTKDGLPIWSNQLTKAGTFTPSGSVVVDKNGNIYTFTNGFDSLNHIFTGIKPVGITKFSPQGNILWHVGYSVSFFGTPMTATRLPIQIDDNNDVYVALDGQAGGQLLTFTLGNLTTNISNERYYLSIGSISSSGNVKWVRGFIFHVLTGFVNLAASTSISLAGNVLFVSGWNTNVELVLDNGLRLPNNRSSAWLAAFDCTSGQSKWGKTHGLFYFCAGSTCGWSIPSIMGSASSGKIALTNNLNGAFVFKPLDTIASITAIGQTAVKSYYTIYDTSGNPIKGKIIENMPSLIQYNEILAGSRNNFLFVHFNNNNPVPGFRDTLRKVDTGFNLIWRVTLPTAMEKVFIPQNSNDIIATYTRSGVMYLAKMTDSAAVISGRTYADWNNDGVYTSADSALSNILITTTNPVVNGISTSDTGKYYIYVAPGTYTLKANFNHPYYQFLPATHTVTINAPGDSITGKDFRLRPLFTFTDVSVNFSALSVARPGGNASYNVTVKNIGATPTSIDVGLKLPPLTSYGSIIGGTVTVNAPDSITIAMGSVNPFATRSAILFLNISTTATTNDTLRYYSKAYPYVTDTIKQNNRDTLIQAVRTSFDPNEKEVNVQKQPYTDTGKAIIYTVHFQNTGNDTAFYVRIADTLSSKHDIRTFNFINASHPVSTEVKNNIINFIFNPIILPDSGHSEPKSHGFVKFSIKPKFPISITDTLYNNAAIYFDYNSPVITNRVKSWYYIPSPPPVIVLLSFTGQIQGNTVRLNFTTGSEPGLMNFVIERSLDSINYIPLGTINSAGTSTTGSSYQFIDASPNPVANFYRLKIVYTDGRIAYSSVVVIRFPIIPPSIVLLSFTGQIQGNTVRLNFTTGSEPGLLNFVIERSTDSVNYIPLGTINSAGTATTGSSYQFIDASPNPVANFYRLKIVYTNGRISYSGIVIIKYSISPPSDITVIKVYPNPVKGIVYISIKNAPDPKIFDCTLADAAGKIVWAATINTSVSDIHPLHINFLSDGIYFLTLAHKNFAHRKLITVIH